MEPPKSKFHLTDGGKGHGAIWIAALPTALTAAGGGFKQRADFPEPRSGCFPDTYAVALSGRPWLHGGELPIVKKKVFEILRKCEAVHRQSRRQSQRIKANRIRVHERVSTNVERFRATGDLFDRQRNILDTSEFRYDDIETERVSGSLHCRQLRGDSWIGEIARDRQPV